MSQTAAFGIEMKIIKIGGFISLLCLSITACAGLNSASLEKVRDFDLANIYLSQDERAQLEIYPIGNGFNSQNRQINIESPLNGKFLTKELTVDYSRKSRSATSSATIFSNDPQLKTTVDKTTLNINIADNASNNLSETKCVFNSKETTIGWFELGKDNPNISCDIKNLMQSTIANLLVGTQLNENAHPTKIEVGTLGYFGDKITIESLHDYPFHASLTPTGYRFTKDHKVVALLDISTKNEVYVAKDIDSGLRQALLASSLSLALYWQK